VKALLALPAIALVGLCVGACGGGGSAPHRSSNVAATAGPRPADASGVKPAHGYMRDDEDASTDDEGSRSDDLGNRGYGREATPAERRALTVVVSRYYAAASAGDGAAACAQIYSKLANSSNLEQALPEDQRAAPGSAVFRGKDCAQVESLLFEVDHQQLVGQAATLQVIRARVEGASGLVLLGFRSTGEREIPLQREGGVWKIDAPLDQSPP
jgi:hypothetical protein